MSTIVKIEIEQAHHPVDVFIVNPIGESISPPVRLENVGDGASFCVHANARLEVREVTP